MRTRRPSLPPFRVVLQARTNSSRLPAKVLLPLGGHPLAVLAASRVARDGGDVVVAIPEGAQDDLLARALAAAGLKTVRGPLEDVLGRFLLATRDMDPQGIVVRMTCDNPLPDAGFVEAVVENYHGAQVRYLAYGNDGQWLPYGLSAEVFRVADLRAAAGSDDPYVREHVTPSIRAAHAPWARPALPDWSEDRGHLRCTVDTLEDYLRVSRLFTGPDDGPDDGHADPVGTPWRSLADRLAETEGPKRTPAPVLGTVQLGLPYGQRRDRGLMAEPQARAILSRAAELGWSGLDTARAYGDSEARIGRFRADRDDAPPVITKLSPMAEGVSAEAAETSLSASLRALGGDRLDTLLLHRAEHMEAAGGRVWSLLREMQAAGRIGRIGLSVQTPGELDAALARPEVQHVQLPFNLLDWRWEGRIAALRARPDLTVHVRSVFLQGLLAQEAPAPWPEVEGVDGDAYRAAIAALVRELERANAADLCLAYVRAFGWIDGLVLGVDEVAQLEELDALLARPPLTWEEVTRVREVLPRAPETLLNPALWPAPETPKEPETDTKSRIVRARARDRSKDREKRSADPAPRAPWLDPSAPFTVFRDPDVMASFPSLAMTASGPLLAFRLAPREPHDHRPGPGHQQHLHPRSFLATTRLDDRFRGGAARLFPADPFAADQDPNLTRLSDGTLLMSSFSWRPQAVGREIATAPGFFHEKTSGQTAQFWGSFTSRSTDDGESWGPRVLLPGLPGYPDLVPGRRPWHGGRHRGQVVETADGRLLIGTYDRKRDDLPFESFLHESTDGGASWAWQGVLSRDAGVGHAEPTLHLLPGGDLLAFQRSFGAGDRLALARSPDEGRHWGPAELLPLIGHPFHVVTLTEDWAVLLYGLRGRISSIRACLLDRRQGTLAGEEVILREGARSQDIGYPTGLLLQEGRLLVCYYWVDDTGARLIEGVTMDVIDL